MFLISSLVFQMLQKKRQSLSGLVHGFTTMRPQQLLESVDTNQEHLSKLQSTQICQFILCIFVWNTKPASTAGQETNYGSALLAVPVTAAEPAKAPGTAELPHMWDVQEGSVEPSRA